MPPSIVCASCVFLSTLSLRRATGGGHIRKARAKHFYPRSPCGERPQVFQRIAKPFRISIHALLAESDPFVAAFPGSVDNFYPRSPCGERLNEIAYQRQIYQFLSTLSLRRATTIGPPCVTSFNGFLSTLSLRRATAVTTLGGSTDRDFYPRSPCGERP